MYVVVYICCSAGGGELRLVSSLPAAALHRLGGVPRQIGIPRSQREKEAPSAVQRQPSREQPAVQNGMAGSHHVDDSTYDTTTTCTPVGLIRHL